MSLLGYFRANLKGFQAAKGFMRFPSSAAIGGGAEMRKLTTLAHDRPAHNGSAHAKLNAG